MKLSVFSIACIILAPFAFADDPPPIYSTPERGSGEELEYVKFFNPTPKQHYKSGDNMNFDYRVYRQPDGNGGSLSVEISIYDSWLKKYYVITKDAPVDVSDSETFHDFHYQWLINKNYDWKGKFELTISEKYEKERHTGKKTIYFPIYVDSDDSHNDTESYNGYNDDGHDDSDNHRRHHDDDDDDDDDHYHHHHDDDDYHHRHHDDDDDYHHRHHDDDDDDDHHHHHDDDYYHHSHDSHHSDDYGHHNGSDQYSNSSDPSYHDHNSDYDSANNTDSNTTDDPYPTTTDSSYPTTTDDSSYPTTTTDANNYDYVPTTTDNSTSTMTDSTTVPS